MTENEYNILKELLSRYTHKYDEKTKFNFIIDKKRFKSELYRGNWQNIMQAAVGVHLTHIPTGISYMYDKDRSVLLNRKKCYYKLLEKIEKSIPFSTTKNSFTKNYISIREKYNNIGTISTENLLEKFKKAIENHFDAELVSYSFLYDDVSSLKDCINATPIDVNVVLDIGGIQESHKVELSQTWLYD